MISAEGLEQTDLCFSLSAFVSQRSSFKQVLSRLILPSILLHSAVLLPEGFNAFTAKHEEATDAVAEGLSKLKGAHAKLKGKTEESHEENDD